MKIGFFDSGIGGLTTLAETLKLTPNASYIYYLDNKNAFFGDKTERQIIDFSLEAVKYFLSQSVDIIVFACNTATAAAANVLRGRFSCRL